MALVDQIAGTSISVDPSNFWVMLAFVVLLFCFGFWKIIIQALKEDGAPV